MFNAASKLSFTAAAGALVAGFAAVFATSDRVAFSALVFAAVAAVVVGLAVFYFAPRDPVVPASAEVEAAAVQATDPTDVPEPSVWPLVAAIATVLVAVGLVVDRVFVVLGLLVAAAAALGWLAQAWREHPSWTQAMTDRLNDRFVVPVGLPVLVITLVVLSAVSLSRIFLAVSADAAPLIGIVVAFSLLGAFYLLSARESLGRGALVTLVVLAGLLVLGAGVAGVVAGEREFHEAGAAHGEGVVGPVELEADDLAFDHEDLQLPATTKVVVEFVNADDPGVDHNFAVYTEQGGDQLFAGEIVPGGSTAEYEFTTPDPGSYFFQCDVHPAQMNGTVTVVEEASGGGAAPEPTPES